MLVGIRQNDNPAADGPLRRIAAEHEVITPLSKNRAFQADLRHRRFARRQFIAVEKNDPTENFAGTEMEADSLSIHERFRGVGHQMHARIHHERRGDGVGSHDPVSPFDGRFFHAVKCHGCALAGPSLLDIQTVNLD